MDAVKFLMEFNRMHQECDCENCPRYEQGCSLIATRETYLEKMVLDVEKWSKEHPQRTRLQDFKEKYPNAEVYPDGQPVICCARLGYRKYCGKSFDDNHEGFKVCFNCWNMPVEDE